MEKAARRIVARLRRHGFDALYAGGWVRDHLLGRPPQDVDIATSALPEDVRRLFRHTIELGAQFGVIQVRMHGRPYAVATFRTESGYADGRHPGQVAFTVAREDALRRDFTINGLFYDPLSGEVIDYVNGAADLDRKLVRTIGQPRERFAEDRLRMLRAVRFACSLGFAIDGPTWDAIREQAHEIVRVSGERIRDELVRILTAPGRGRGLDLMLESGLLAHVLPEVRALRGVGPPPGFEEGDDAFAHTRRTLQFLRSPTPLLAMGALLHEVGKPRTSDGAEGVRFRGHALVGGRMAGEICRRLRFSNREKAGIVALVTEHLRLFEAQSMRSSVRTRFFMHPMFYDHLELHRANCLGSNAGLETYTWCRRERKRLEREFPDRKNLIDGHDLIRMGYLPGPQFRRILQDVEDLQLEGRLRNRRSALRWVRSAYPRPQGRKQETR